MKRGTVLLCAALLLLMLAACGGGGSPQKTVAAFFDAAKTIDIEKMNACLASDQMLTWDLEADSGSETTQGLMQLLRTLASKLSYRLNDCARDGDAATAAVTVTYADASMTVKDALTDVMADLLATLFGAQTETDPETLLVQALQEKLETGNPPMKTAELTLQLQNTEDGWRITALPDELMNMMTGNAVDAFEEAVQSLTGK